MMNGAQTLIRTLVASGVDVCFSNPGTSEMHFVAALDQVPEMRAVLGLFEGAVTGAADGYGRMAGRPAATLLHLGPGLANGLANLHNAMRARTPIVNVIGDHATYHKQYDAPLESDVEGYARPVSGWVVTSQAPERVAGDGARAVAAARAHPGQIASLILPADVSWGAAEGPAPPVEPQPARQVPETTVEAIAEVLRGGEPCALLMGGTAVLREGLMHGARVATKTGAKFLCETFPARLSRGAGVPVIERLAYLAEMAAGQLAGLKHLVLVDTKAPVSFFAYPDKPSYLVPEGCSVHTLAAPGDDAVGALSNLSEALGAAGDSPPVQAGSQPDAPTGPLDAKAVGEALCRMMPEGAIVVDEGNSAGVFVPIFTMGAPAHDWLCLTGGAIGQGIPVATGAAVACPGRRVINLEADGSAMYTLQGLWTQARENLDVTTIVLSNRAYAVLDMELSRVGAEAGGERARAMLDLSRPELDFALLARGMGVPATRATTAEAFSQQLQAALAQSGPNLIEAVL
ncbi:MAG: acetolactate synthase large subunit [Myxococcales bacterium]|nr:acetolactate synthase large subunit [Myxococcales bacterium]MDD9967502.1 acetolactate synthase large subunit [Myxococcales bacterium]